jgi:L-ascorbate metabolism protein UlaG (beta-lactamase superfamily)
MKIKWFGHSCFLLTADRGPRILTDPFDDSVGYPVPRVAADIVTTSHKHFDHSYIQAVSGQFTHFSQSGRYSAHGVDITGVAAFHDEAGGSKRGQNVIFVFALDGLRVCHCGDLGHSLTAEQVREIGLVDILLVPVGGFYTIDAVGAAQISKALDATVIIPMHYKTDVLSFPIAGVDPFLTAMGGGRRAGAREITVNKDTLLNWAGVVILEYK